MGHFIRLCQNKLYGINVSVRLFKDPIYGKISSKKKAVSGTQ